MTNADMHADRDYLATLRRLIDGTLDPQRFDHKDHVGVAFEAMARHEFFEAAHLLADGLRGLATRAGVPEKFNATVTMAYLSLIGERMQDRDFRDGNAFLRANPDLIGGDVLARWYSKERLNAAVAKKVAVLPALDRRA